MTIAETIVVKTLNLICDQKIILEALPRPELTWILQKMCETRYFEEKAEEFIEG